MKKDLLLLAVLVLAAILLFNGVEFQTVEEYYQAHPDDIREDSETVFFSIRCDSVLGQTDKMDPDLREWIPEDGIIIEKGEYVLRNGDSVFDLLCRIARYRGLSVVHTASAAGQIYVSGIGQLHQYTCGELSGWTYAVNGVVSMQSSDSYCPKDGDVVEWIYVCGTDGNI